MEQNQERNEEIEIDLREIFIVLWQKALVILLSGLTLALVVMLATKLFVTPQYESTTRMYVLAKQNSDTLTSSDLQMSTNLTNDYAELITSRAVTESVIAELGLDMKHEELVRKMEVTVPTDTRILAISVTDEDPYMARDLADTIREVAADHIQQVMDVEAVNVADYANIPDTQSSPSVIKYGLIAGILGCVLAVAVVLIQHLSNDTIKTSEDVERYLHLSTLGTIPLAENESRSKKRRIKDYKKV